MSAGRPGRDRRSGWHGPAFTQDFMSRGAQKAGPKQWSPGLGRRRRAGKVIPRPACSHRYSSSACHVWIRARIVWKALPPIRRKDMDRPADRFSGNARRGYRIRSRAISLMLRVCKARPPAFPDHAEDGRRKVSPRRREEQKDDGSRGLAARCIDAAGGRSGC